MRKWSEKIECKKIRKKKVSTGMKTIYDATERRENKAQKIKSCKAICRNK